MKQMLFITLTLDIIQVYDIQFVSSETQYIVGNSAFNSNVPKLNTLTQK